jgi:hypothetical protein
MCFSAVVCVFKLPKFVRMLILVCQKFVHVRACVRVCVYVFPHGCGLIYRRIRMKLGTQLDDDAEKVLKSGFSGSLILKSYGP